MHTYGCSLVHSVAGFRRGWRLAVGVLALLASLIVDVVLHVGLLTLLLLLRLASLRV